MALRFYDSNETILYEYDPHDFSLWGEEAFPTPPIWLEDNEEIIGIYGCMNGLDGTYFYIEQLGFLVKVKPERKLE